MVRQHKALGPPIVVARDKRVVHLDPNTMEEIPPDQDLGKDCPGSPNERRMLDQLESCRNSAGWQ